MTRKKARFLILGNLLALSFASSLFAMNAEMPGEVNAAREIIPLNLPQNNFSIDSANNLPVEGMGLISNSENTQLIQEPAQLAPSPFQGEGRGEGKINKKTTTPHPK